MSTVLKVYEASHLPAERLAVITEAEQSEREIAELFIGCFDGFRREVRP
jgi:hypothetical protein